MPTCQKRTNLSFLRANVPLNVPRSASFSTWCTNVPDNVLIYQLGVPSYHKAGHYFKHSSYGILKEISILNYYTKNSTLYLISLCICIVHKNCIILHFYASCHIKGKCVEFFLSFFLSCSLVRNENLKRPGFNTLQVTRIFPNFPQLKQLNKIKNTYKYYDFLEL